MITDLCREENWEKFSLTLQSDLFFRSRRFYPYVSAVCPVFIPSVEAVCLGGITTENRHDKMNRNLSGLVHSISEKQWLVYTKKFLNLNIRKFKHDSIFHRKTTTFPTSTHPAMKYCSYSHLIPFTFHCGQKVDSLSGQEVQRFDFQSDEGAHAWEH